MEDKNEVRSGLALMVVSVAGGIADDELRTRLSALDPDDWVSLDIVINVIRKAEAQSPDKAKAIGRSIIYAGKETFLKPFEPLSSVKLISLLDTVYKGANRGPIIGYYKVIGATKGSAVVETTDHCGENFVEGLLNGALRVTGADNVKIEKRRARSRGDAVDEFALTWDE